MKSLLMRRCCFIFLMWIALLPEPAFAENFTVYIGVIPPFTAVDTAGKAYGASVDIVDEMMKAVGKPINLEEIRAISWARSIEDTETTSATMLFGVVRTPQREDKFKWVGPIAELNLGLVARKQSRIVIHSHEDLHRYHIGVIRNSAPVQILGAEYAIPTATLTLLANDLLQFKMLTEGRVDLITQADTAAPAWLKQLNMDQDDYEMVHVMKHLQLYIAFNKQTDDALIARLQSALNALKAPHGKKASRYDAIMKKYLGQGPIAKQRH